MASAEDKFNTIKGTKPYTLISTGTPNGASTLHTLQG